MRFIDMIEKKNRIDDIGQKYRQNGKGVHMKFYITFLKRKPQYKKLQTLQICMEIILYIDWIYLSSMKSWLFHNGMGTGYYIRSLKLSPLPNVSH